MIGSKKLFFLFLRKNHSPLRPQKIDELAKQMDIDGDREEEYIADDYPLQYI